MSPCKQNSKKTCINCNELNNKIKEIHLILENNKKEREEKLKQKGCGSVRRKDYWQHYNGRSATVFYKLAAVQIARPLRCVCGTAF